MTSAVPVQVIDDDEEDAEFDWEAAVREIDVSCQNAKPSTSSTPQNCSSSYFAPPDGTTSMRNSNNLCSVKKGPSTCKQSTLDKFIGKEIPRPHSEGLEVENPKEVWTEADERVPFVAVDAEAAKTWIYPVNIPYRDYQFAITKTALFSNTLVALPTGLGKTLIAAVVMYNYFRWFPDGKIVFAAPSRPLVMQQIEACHNVVGIPQEWTIDMTGQVSPTRRACFWKEKRVFFVTPQVLEKDIQSGTCLVKYLVCLVIDEAHRALGNYSYCVAIRELMDVPVQLRILALTATPGSKQQTIQLVIDNLRISTLEHRNENDHDVSPFVHERKIELIEVPLGRDAVEINKRLLEVIHPYVVRLSFFGLLQNRDYQTLSPCDLLNSRDKFRQAPSHPKIGEIEAYFSVLITLYHIRKLLASHGIRPAYEMLEEKLKQGYFARLMSKNEDIINAKLLMERSLSHGAPSPKLSKMIEVLVDHFKAKDPQNSRVIIFSNFRGSVRDIMNALANVGHVVKATEFIGQSSGKALKGQSQKVQQAVLQKFRAGGYNVIVATSIGEEGLDIVEVDLVICFDANISPLRMIQRMGRTGRKNDGRVVVLACEGSELKGYARKQANSTAVKKHMRHGGMNSFNFHPSPRMIPHILKPEVQYVELSIEQFIPRGKKLKDDDHSIQAPVFDEKLTIAEIDSIAKYFHPNSENNWRPSLIAFPRFQASPSRVHKVKHSCRTGILTETMQELLGLSLSRGKRTSFVEVCLPFVASSLLFYAVADSTFSDNSPGIKSHRQATGSEVSPVRSLRTEKNSLPNIGCRINPTHSYLFGSDFVSVDALGKVLITSVPSFPFKELPHSICISDRTAVLLNHSNQSSSLLESLTKGHEEIFVQAIDTAVIATSQRRCKTKESLPKSKLLNCSDQQGRMIDEIETVPESPILRRNVSSERECVAGMLDASEIKAPPVLSDEYDGDFRDAELSPRLTNMIKNGVLPESPISPTNEYNDDFRDAELSPRQTSMIKNGVLPVSPISQRGLLDDKKGNEFPISTVTMEMPSKSSTPRKKEVDNWETRYCGRTSLLSHVNREVQSPLCNMHNIADTTGYTNSASPVTEGLQSPTPNLTNSSNSKDWRLSSGGQSDSVKRAHRFKRLCKIGEHGKKRNPGMNENSVLVANLAGSFYRTSPNQMKHRTGKRKPADNIRAFIEDEAEVSSDAEISDEEDDVDSCSFDDSFLDDRINPTAASTQAEAGRADMMAIYRRSLLSQSPIHVQSHSSAITPDSGVSMIRTNKSGSSPACSLQTPQTDCAKQSDSTNLKSFGRNSERLSGAMTSKNAEYPTENGVMENRKRKLSFHHSGNIPAVKLQHNLLSMLEVEGRESIPQDQSDKTDENGEMLCDDQFYENIDFDALEAQATLLLNHKPEEAVRSQDTNPQSNQQNSFLTCSPSFDLGIL
ncbi:hypothetical protein HS088_TW18G00828 [Tripterygium wilfordii]|uniref:DEAD/DEAH box RNA helicase family protein n=1 Tax=Tripterygium wilfordii TaxID=458696 RepID=A0A7J7CDD1_TRIWF|nr:hypothetical protein HS088_TW18G00828 [Tripterygium wilfordii]